MKIAIAGLGYVGLSSAVLLAQQNEVVAVDIAADKVAMLNNKQSPFEDAEKQLLPLQAGDVPDTTPMWPTWSSNFTTSPPPQ